MHHQCSISASSAHHQHIINASSLHRQCIISAPSKTHLEFDMPSAIGLVFTKNTFNLTKPEFQTVVRCLVLSRNAYLCLSPQGDSCVSGPGARDAIASQNKVHQVVEGLFSSGKPLRCLTDTKTAFWRKESLSVRFSDVGSQPTIASRSGTNISADRSFFGKPPGWRWLNVALRVPPTALNMSPDLDSRPVEIMILILNNPCGHQQQDIRQKFKAKLLAPKGKVQYKTNKMTRCTTR